MTIGRKAGPCSTKAYSRGRIIAPRRWARTASPRARSRSSPWARWRQASAPFMTRSRRRWRNKPGSARDREDLKEARREDRPRIGLLDDDRVAVGVGRAEPRRRAREAQRTAAPGADHIVSDDDVHIIDDMTAILPATDRHRHPGAQGD